jgi:hypothetical protein
VGAVTTGERDRNRVIEVSTRTIGSAAELQRISKSGLLISTLPWLLPIQVLKNPTSARVTRSFLHFQLEQWILDVHRCSDSSRVLWNWDVLHGLYGPLPLFTGQYSVGGPSEPNLLRRPGIDRRLGGFH